jgi:Phosphotransferase enzyme family
MEDPYSVPIEPFRSDLPDNIDIKLTHGDLHPSNIVITESGPPKVVALIDWEQSGWLPAYWEDRKAHLTAEYGGEWAKVYLPIILDQYESTRDAGTGIGVRRGAFRCITDLSLLSNSYERKEFELS